MTTEIKRPAPPYVAFRTFNNVIDWLEEGIPQRFDRSFWESKLSGAYGSQTVAALRFFGLLDAQNKPTDELERFVKDKPNRKEHMGSLLSRHYPEVFALGLSDATPKMLSDEFAKYPIDRSTLRKAETFFLHAAKYAGIPVSSFIAKQVRGRATTETRRKPVKRKKSGADQNGGGETPPPPAIDSALAQRPLLAELLKALPAASSWTKEERERWMTLWSHTIDWYVKVK